MIYIFLPDTALSFLSQMTSFFHPNCQSATPQQILIEYIQTQGRPSRAQTLIFTRCQSGTHPHRHLPLCIPIMEHLALHLNESARPFVCVVWVDDVQIEAWILELRCPNWVVQIEVWILKLRCPNWGVLWILIRWVGLFCLRHLCWWHLKQICVSPCIQWDLLSVSSISIGDDLWGENWTRPMDECELVHL